ncbi:hypothetical protein [Nocardioides deserti]|uniref:Fibronectin type-III domain-containing protein n=1 Tax=Nocardioides deserti TaxID=1588644 RepID=A0ABR6U772_9ACTN|nr:hypothetical protein [Nocardioides deserti]MBC2960292.1 hypothetical protein [Nocardioides deserti]
MRVRAGVLALATAVAGLPLALPGTGTAAPVPVDRPSGQSRASMPAPATRLLVLPARPADSLVDAYGVGIHTPFLDTPYADAGRVADALADLGVRHVRDDLFLRNPRQYKAIRTIAKRGIDFDLIMGRPDRPGTPADYVRTLAEELPKSAVEAVEGINEWDHFGRGRDWAREAAAWQRELYEKVKGTPATAHLPVLSPALAFSRNYLMLPDLSPWSDVANIHAYPGGEKPGTALDTMVEALRAVLSPKPVVTTEAGYHNATRTTNGHRPTSERAAGLYLPRLLLEHVQRGQARVYSYELIDEFRDAAKTNPEANFGLLRRDWSPKPAYTAMKTMLGLLADPGPSFAPTPLDLGLSGWPLDGRYVVTQKRDGTYVVLMYRNDSVWDTSTRRDLALDATNVRLDFPRSYGMTVHRLGESAQPVRRTKGTSITLPVDGAVTALTLDPRAGSTRPVTARLKARPGHRSATVRWELAGATKRVAAVRVKRSPGGVVRRLGPAVRRYRDTGLVNGRRYTYTVRVVTRSGPAPAPRSVTVVPGR